MISRLDVLFLPVALFDCLVDNRLHICFPHLSSRHNWPEGCQSWQVDLVKHGRRWRPSRPVEELVTISSKSLAENARWLGMLSGGRTVSAVVGSCGVTGRVPKGEAGRYIPRYLQGTSGPRGRTSSSRRGVVVGGGYEVTASRDHGRDAEQRTVIEAGLVRSAGNVVQMPSVAL